MFPQGRARSLNWMNGYFREETGISAMVSFHQPAFSRDVACFDMEALALNRWMKAFKSSAFFGGLAVSFCFCFRISWLAWYRKS